jgi:hypothetical protein
MVKVGDTVYLWSHAYLRVVGEVSEVLGQRRVSLVRASIVQGDSGNYTEFFGRGVSGKTEIQYIGTVGDIAYLAAFEFNHPLPGPKNTK